MPTAEQKAYDDAVFQVRDLRNQIAYWKTQYANDPVTNYNAPSVIDDLQRKIGCIPNSGTMS